MTCLEYRPGYVAYFSFNGSSSPFRAQSLIQFRNHFSQAVELLGIVISPSQSRYLQDNTNTE
jgi:hypothetical protein